VRVNMRVSVIVSVGMRVWMSGMGRVRLIVTAGLHSNDSMPPTAVHRCSAEQHRIHMHAGTARSMERNPIMFRCIVEQQNLTT
jgi:hypothetical protein